MLQEIPARILWAIGIAAVLFGLYWLGNRVILARVHARRSSLRLDLHPGLETFTPGNPAILYFTTPTCAPCKTVQRPALARLRERLGDGLQVIEVDASARPDLADYWGVLSVPTTFLIDSHGRPRKINHGVAGANKLQKQIEAAEGGMLPAARGRVILNQRGPKVHEAIDERP
jgi:thioredoxin 1